MSGTATYFRRKAEGVCVQCGGPKTDARLRCKRCVDTQAAYYREWQLNRRPATPVEFVEDGIARCVCGLRLSTKLEVAQGSCGSCLPTAAEMAGRRGAWE